MRFVFSGRMKFLCFMLIAGLCPLAATAAEHLVYFGTYTGGKSKGIYVSRFDATTGKLTEPELAAETKNPSFLALHPTEKYLYAVGEVNVRFEA